jgi:hypothetical protein
MKKPSRPVAPRTSIVMRDSAALARARGGLVSNFNVAPPDDQTSDSVRVIVVNHGPLESW